MSSHSYSSTCPNCNNDMDSCSSNRPYENTTHWCPHCGFVVTAVADYMDLEELNDYRDGNELEPLKKLPEQDLSLKTYHTPEPSKIYKRRKYGNRTVIYTKDSGFICECDPEDSELIMNALNYHHARQT